MKAYGFASSLTEPEVVSRLFEMYAKIVSGLGKELERVVGVDRSGRNG